MTAAYIFAIGLEWIAQTIWIFSAPTERERTEVLKMRMIDAKKLETQTKELFQENPVVMGVLLRWIRKQPTVDAVPIRRGMWIDARDYLKCPKCREIGRAHV